MSQSVEKFMEMTPRAEWAAAVCRWQEGAAIDAENFRGFRDDPSTHDENHIYRTALWAGMAAEEYAAARELLSVILLQPIETTI